MIFGIFLFLLENSVASAHSLRNTESVISPDGKIRYIVRYYMEGFDQNEIEKVKNSLKSLSKKICIDFIKVSSLNNHENLIHMKGPTIAKTPFFRLPCFSILYRS